MADDDKKTDGVDGYCDCEEFFGGRERIEELLREAAGGRIYYSTEELFAALEEE